MNETLTEPQGEIEEPEPVETGDHPEEPEEPIELSPTPEEPEDAVQSEPAIDPVEMEKTYRKIEQAATTYRRRVADLLGDAILGFTPCPLCSDGIMGHLPPLEDAQPATELEARLLDVLKTPQAPEYRPAPNARRCGTCDGWGAVLSGSRLANKDRVRCPTCMGNGYQGDELTPSAPPSGNGVVAFDPPEDQTPLTSDDPDMWGTPKYLADGQRNPNWGMMPQYKDPTLP